MFKKVYIRKHETGLVFRRGDLDRVLPPGRHTLWGWDVFAGRIKVEVFNRLEPKFEHKLLDVLLAEDSLRQNLLVLELSDEQRALVWKDGRLGWILPPGRHAFWKRPYTLDVEVFDIKQLRFTHPKLEAVLNHPGGARFFEGVRVEPHEQVLLFHEGKLVETLGPGLHVYWKDAGKTTWKAVDLREQTIDIAGQEIMTADKVTLRVNLVLTFQVTDVVKSATVVSDHQQTLYREAQLVLRAAIGTRPLEQLLADKEAVGAEVRNALAQRAGEFGVTVRSVGMRDIILPGEMKTLLNQVIEAQKKAEANLIRRREEIAAVRSQMNTAKLMAENPVLNRMKELEAVQEILAGAKSTFFFGNGDLSQQIRQLVARTPPDSPDSRDSAEAPKASP